MISNRNLILLAGVWLSMGAIAPRACLAQEESPCGLVIGLTVTGKWRVGDRELTLKDRVSKAALRTRHEGEPGTLTVWFEGEPPHVYSCEGESCNLDVSNCAAQKAGGRNIWDWIVGEPERYFTAASRGLEGDLKEAVVRLTGPQADVAPAMAELSAATYWVRFEPLAGDAPKTAASQVQWAGKSALTSTSGLKPGLYRLVLLDETGEPTGSEAWILLCAPPDYSTASAAFAKAVHTVAGWPSEVDPAAVRAFLRASLEELSKQKDSGKP